MRPPRLESIEQKACYQLPGVTVKVHQFQKRRQCATALGKRQREHPAWPIEPHWRLVDDRPSRRCDFHNAVGVITDVQVKVLLILTHPHVYGVCGLLPEPFRTVRARCLAQSGRAEFSTNNPLRRKLAVNAADGAVHPT